MFTVTKALEEALHQHFISQKLKISYAINKPFPFFEGLRDSSFITERMYRESLEACGNLVPVSRVVYNILTQLEKTFALSLLVTLFSQINLHEYPNLKAILGSFRSVGVSHGERGRAMPISMAAPADPAEGSSLQTLLMLPPSQPPLPNALSCAPRVGELGTSAQKCKAILLEPLSPASPAMLLPGFIQEGRITPVTSDNLMSKINDDENSPERPTLPPGTMQGIRDDSPKPGAPKESQEASSTPANKKGKKRKKCVWSTSKRRHHKKKLSRGAASPVPGIQEELQEVDQVTQMKDDSTSRWKVMTRAQKARTECAQMSETEDISDDISETNEEKCPQDTPRTPPRIMLDSIDNGNKPRLEKSPEKRQKRRKKCIWSSSRRRPKKRFPRVSEKPEDETMDFQSPILPVTCGEAKGILFKEKMKKGASEKCIQNEKGVWFTPKEFEKEGNRAKSKNWRRSVHCRGKTLQYLLEKELLFCPSRINPRREPDTWDQCEVCCRRGRLLCCATCLRSFHRDCHIPPEEAERAPWSCTFCRMKESSRNRRCHGELKPLERRMLPEEQLKCESLLLKAYCHPQSSFFAETPRNNSDFGQVGLDLEAELEKDLREVLVAHEGNRKSFLAPL
ncbi:sp110 nuclear body protein isoform X2 [Tamandua tetradactyla]|uniref:sp110 nuclear body protein isoform X2 n=1 Tax=Tamandua tetradactyla TaxID=48850 RepID=UPI004054529A